MTGPQPRNGIMDLPPYVGGKESLPGQEKIFRLSENENPLGASPNALEAYRMAGENLEIYPDGHSVALREVLAKAHKLDVNKIVCGFGSQ